MDAKPIEQAIALLRNTNTQITELLSESFPEFHTRSSYVLDRLIYGLLHAIGSNSVAEEGNTFKAVSLAEEWKKEDNPNATFISLTTETAQEEDIIALRTTAEKLYETFTSRSNKDIMEAVLPIEIKAVAKLAGIAPIEQPEIVDYAFIDKIKVAIREKENKQTKINNWSATEEKLSIEDTTKEINAQKQAEINTAQNKKISKRAITKK